MEKPFQHASPFDPTHSQASEQQPIGSHQPARSGKRARRKWLKKAILAIVVIAVAAIGAFYLLNRPPQVTIDKSGYQAVFLANGQVYFGKLQQDAGGYLSMTEIYYLQVQDAQPNGSAVKDANKTQQDVASGDTRLIKLGEELHAPKDYMVINKDQMLFWENLKDNGKVALAIKSYKSKD